MNEQINARIETLRMLDSIDQANMLKAARSSYAEAQADQAECEAIDAELMDQLRLLKEQITNNRARLSDAIVAIRRNIEIIGVLEAEKAARQIRSAAE
jgi:hypothetical protein